MQETLVESQGKASMSVGTTLKPVGDLFYVEVSVDKVAAGMAADVLTGAWSANRNSAAYMQLKFGTAGDEYSWVEAFKVLFIEYVEVAVFTRVMQVTLRRRKSPIRDARWIDVLVVQDMIKGLGRVEVPALGYILEPRIPSADYARIEKLLKTDASVQRIKKFCEDLQSMIDVRYLEAGVDYTNWEGDLAVMTASKGKVKRDIITTGRGNNVDDKTFARSLVLDVEVDSALRVALSGFIYRSVAEGFNLFRFNIASMTKLTSDGNR